MRGKDGKGRLGEVIWGDTLILHNTPVSIDVLIPGGKWELLATPKNGWPNYRYANSQYFLFGLIFTFLISSIFWVLINKNEEVLLWTQPECLRLVLNHGGERSPYF